MYEIDQVGKAGGKEEVWAGSRKGAGGWRWEGVQWGERQGFKPGLHGQRRARDARSNEEMREGRDGREGAEGTRGGGGMKRSRCGPDQTEVGRRGRTSRG